MNRENIKWALAQVCCFPDIKAVLLILAIDADDGGCGHIALRDLSSDTEIEERRLPFVLRTLQDFDLVTANIDAGTVAYKLVLGASRAGRG